VFYAAALYPESEKLVEVSSLFKVEGTFLNPADGFKNGWGVGGRAEKQGMALLMADEGGCSTMLNWIVGLADVFKVIFSFSRCGPHHLPSNDLSCVVIRST
jgi:CCR4-NOT transcriptional complex subunit CAF120